jgi:hypothetical protein
MRFYFWNNGRLPIKAENIRRPLRVVLDDDQGEILDFKLINVTRPDVTGVRIVRDRDDPRRALELTFGILEELDGFTSQLVFAGKAKSNIKVDGVIEGVKEVKTNLEYSSEHYWYRVARYLLFFAAFIAIVVLYSKLVDWIKLRFARTGLRDTRVGKVFASIGRLAVVTGGVVISLFMFIGLVSIPFQQADKDVTKNIVELVPAAIKP